VVHEMNVDNYLASRAFKFVFQHFYGISDVESCLEAIVMSFCHSIPIKMCIPEQHPDTLEDLYWLAVRVEEYVRGDRDINDFDVYGVTLMDSACSTGATSLIEPVFRRGAKFGNKSLLYAVRSGSFDTVRFCLALGADPNDYPPYWGNRGGSPLMLASSKSETSHLVSLLIDYGANVFVRNGNWETPLHLAARRADVDLLRVLLARDSSSEFLEATNEEGDGALQYAIENVDPETPEDQAIEFVSALLDAGADVHGFHYHQSALRKAVMFDCGAVLQLLLSREPESPQKTQYLKEALMDAIDGGFRGTFEILVEAGASVDDETLRNVLESGSLEQ
jgi:ankyrin repeat protein